MRRLPVYLLLDISGSMRGEPIKAVNLGIKTLIDELKSNPFALETAYISIITFNDQVEQTVPLTELYNFRAPILNAKLGTYLGKAIKFLSAKAEEEVVKTSTTVKGDWKPLVFLMTDGRSGDKVEKALTEFNKKQFGCIVACAYGDKANIEALKLITDNVIQMKQTDTDSIMHYFRWVSASLSTSSQRVTEGSAEIDVLDDLPPLPPKINLVK